MTPFLIGIAGGTGSGKTTVANAIVTRVGAERIAILSHDSYYRDASHLTPEERHAINYDHPDALETELLVEHLKTLRNGSAVDKQHRRPTHAVRWSDSRVERVPGVRPVDRQRRA